MHVLSGGHYVKREMAGDSKANANQRSNRSLKRSCPTGSIRVKEHAVRAHYRNLYWTHRKSVESRQVIFTILYSISWSLFMTS